MLTLLLRLSRAIDRVSNALGVLVSWLCLLMVLVGAFNAVARYLGRFIGTNLSSNAYLEAQWYMFSALFLLGAAYTLQRDNHVRVDVLYGRLSAKHKAVIDLAGGVLFLLPFCAYGVWASWDYAANSWAMREISPDPGGLPRYPIKALIPLSFAFLGVQGVSEIIKRAALLAGREVTDG
jgi:TRAP-type mannitol/chloroaromatic compound transport system permease small subunit